MNMTIPPRMPAIRIFIKRNDEAPGRSLEGEIQN
jgi:hypothetical protein